MWSAAASAILEGMPEAAGLRVLRSDRVTWILAGKTTLFRFADGDAGMRNIAVAALRQIGFSGTHVAAALGLTTNYVATLHQRAQRDGTAGLVRPRGRPRTVTERDWEQARAWRVAGVRDAEIARRLGVQQSTVLRRLGPARVQGELALEGAVGPVLAAGRGETAEQQPPGPGPEPEAVPGQDVQQPVQSEPAPEPGVVPPGFGGTARAAGGSGVFSRYAGAMLLHAYPGRAGEILPRAAGGEAREAALLSAVSTCFALGAATAEQVKHLVPAEAGPLAGLAALPSLRTLRPRLAAIADAADPLELQAAFAAAMLAATPETSGVYYVDDHFVPYAGAKPVGKGWNNKRGRAEKGRADTHVTTADGRAVCFVTGQPSGLSITLPKALAELAKAVPPGTPIMLGFDRGGAYPAVFSHCRDNSVHWVTYRRAPLADPAITPAAKNDKLIPAAEREIAAARRQLGAAKKARDPIPAKLPANQIDPQAQVALLRTGRRGLQMVLRLLAHNAEHWLSNQLNAYLRDDDEYRAITRETIIRGTAGIIAFAPDTITVTLQQPAEPRVARALALLTDQINATPPVMPGDTRPITYQITASPAI